MQTVEEGEGLVEDLHAYLASEFLFEVEEASGSRRGEWCLCGGHGDGYRGYGGRECAGSCTV
jgi:hypothetical protein